jgi:hypothetical protein
MLNSGVSSRARRFCTIGTIVAGLLVLLVVAGNGGFEAPRSAEATVTTSTWIYPASAGIQVGAGGAAISNPAAFLAPPCTNCYITQIVPDLVYQNDPNPSNHPNGTTANFNNDSTDGVWMHHMVVIDSCTGYRVFASGNERTVWSMPAGYGYYQGSCNWFLNWHIHNNSTSAHGVAVKLTVTYRTGETLTPITPIWIDMSSAANSEYTVNEGYSDTYTGSGVSGINPDWTSNVSGQIVGIGGVDLDRRTARSPIPGVHDPGATSTTTGSVSPLSTTSLMTTSVRPSLVTEGDRAIIRPAAQARPDIPQLRTWSP